MSESNTIPEVKLFVVVRKDLKMPRGKEDAQVGHAVMAFVARRLATKMEFGRLRGEFDLTAAEARWFSSEKQSKIVLEVNSEAELFSVAGQAQEAGLETHLIRDAGLTVFKGVPTYTCLSIGPDFAERIAPITGKLKLRS